MTPVLFLFISSLFGAAPERKLTIYAYDSFSGKGSLGEKVKKIFEEKTKAKLEIVPFGSTGEALNQVALEGKKTRADLVMGVDSGLLPRALKANLFGEFDDSLISARQWNVKPRKEWVPFDYGYLAFVYDKSRYVPKANTTLENIVDDKRLVKKVAIEDPRTSSLGQLFLIWTHSTIGEKEFGGYWKKMAPLLLTISPGWSGAYSLFTQKEVNLVLSYTTSPAYHLEFEKTDKIQAIIFPQGHIQQVEGVMIAKSTQQRLLAHELVAIVLSPKIQAAIPLTNFMYPAIQGTPLPDAFKRLLPQPKAIVATIPDNISDWIKTWTNAVR